MKGVQEARDVMEVTSAPDGRATWEFGAEVKGGQCTSSRAGSAHMTFSAPHGTSNAVRSRTSAGHAATIAGTPIKSGFPLSRKAILRSTDRRPHTHRGMACVLGVESAP